MKNLRITVRLESNDREQIEDLIRSGKVASLSQVIRKALNQYLNNEGER